MDETMLLTVSFFPQLLRLQCRGFPIGLSNVVSFKEKKQCLDFQNVTFPPPLRNNNFS